MRVIVVGVNHRVQRVPPDDTPEDYESRVQFEAALQALIEHEGVDLIAEEAGDDEEVARELQRGEEHWAQFTAITPPRVVPERTLARQVAERTGTCRHTDIRPPSGDFPPGHGRQEEYERSMFERTLQNGGPAKVVLVICGGCHREPLAQLYRSASLEVEDHDFAWLIRHRRTSA